MSRKAALAALAGALALLALGVSTAAAAPTVLVLPQSTAFSYLGHSCGGIQEQSYAIGFAATTGYPTGDVYMQTRCGGSGRGGGYKTTTYSAWATVTWDFGGNVVSSSSGAAPYTPGFSATDANGIHLYDSGSYAYLDVPAPGAPTAVTATPSGGQFLIAWTPAPANPAIITSSTVTATPVGSTAPIVTVGVTGSATSTLIGPLQPSTTYQVTVVNTDAGGTSPPSTPITVVTGASSVVPSAPTGVTARWTAPGSPGDTLVARWLAPAAGDSPIDQYQVTITGSDGGGTFTQTVPGATLTATFAVSDIPDWRVTVRAHNAAGWGPWSAAYTLGGA